MLSCPQAEDAVEWRANHESRCRGNAATFFAKPSERGWEPGKRGGGRRSGGGGGASTSRSATSKSGDQPRRPEQRKPGLQAGKGGVVGKRWKPAAELRPLVPRQPCGKQSGARSRRWAPPSPSWAAWRASARQSKAQSVPAPRQRRVPLALPARLRAFREAPSVSQSGRKMPLAQLGAEPWPEVELVDMELDAAEVSGGAAEAGGTSPAARGRGAEVSIALSPDLTCSPPPSPTFRAEPPLPPGQGWLSGASSFRLPAPPPPKPGRVALEPHLVGE